MNVFPFVMFKTDITDLLLQLQPVYFQNLKKETEDFERNLVSSTNEYDAHGPMESGITIEEATKRVAFFTVCFY
jgi:hypothetical protein